MSEEEKTHYELMEEIIGRKLKPFIILASVLIGIFGVIAVPIAAQVLKLTEDCENIKSSIEKKVDSDEAYKNFLPKGTYHLLQKDEHETDLEALRNPEDADLIYMKHNNQEADRLDIATRSATPYMKKAYDKEKNKLN